MNGTSVAIAGAGIGGLTLALTLQQIGVSCTVFDTVSELKPLGVGINLQPNAVRELFELGITEDELDSIGLQTQEWALVGLNGKDVYSEPRGLAAGYNWPQYSLHRGQLQMLLYNTVLKRLGPDVGATGHRVLSYRNAAVDDGVLVGIETEAGARLAIEADLLVGADGLHSNVRAQMYPDQPEVQWGGAIMWRGVTQGVPVRSGASFVGLGSHNRRVVFYPISKPDPETSLATINWIAEITVDNQGVPPADWSKRVDVDSILHYFSDMAYDWLDVPAMLRGAQTVYEYPMIDREPVLSWVDGNVVLIGDAAHVMYPTGSNGASQAIVDARVLGAELAEHGVKAKALAAYDARLCADVSAVVLRNRGAGPFAILNILDERCGGVFDDIEAVISQSEREEFMEHYRAAAGFELARLNAAPPTIPAGTLVRRKPRH